MRVKLTRRILLLVVLICTIAQSGCFPWRPDFVLIVSQTSYAYPWGFAAEHGPRWETLETDEYGRVLFAYSNGYGSCSVGIRQKNDDEFVYYYDNISFIYTEDTLGDFMEQVDKALFAEQIDELKSANDWNQPLDEEKMIKRRIVNSFLLNKREDLVLITEDLLRFFHASIKQEADVSIQIFIFDESQTRQQLCYINRDREIPTSKEYDYDYEDLDEYLMILNPDGSYDPETYLLKIDDRERINELLAEIKEKSGWVG